VLFHRAVPAAFRRAIETALGVTLVGATVLGAAAPAGASPTPPPVPVTSDAGPFDRPVAPPASGLSLITPPTPVIAPSPARVVRVPRTPPPAATPSPAATSSGPRRAMLDPRLFTGPGRLPDYDEADRPVARDDAHIVVVRRGDTLWSIARRHLGRAAGDAAVDREWRRWYAANRAVIGADPDLILPGQRLVPPAA
jgi:hypothetical protein